MSDRLSQTERSSVISRIRSRGNTSTELAMVKLLRVNKIKRWCRHYRLIGKPDFVYAKPRVAIFVDGCFRHGCPTCLRLPFNRRDYWRAKISANRGRDRRISRQLRKIGCKVIRVWEHDLKWSSCSKVKATRSLKLAGRICRYIGPSLCLKTLKRARSDKL